MSSLNSSGARERFTLASGESKSFVNDDKGSNYADVTVKGDDQAAASVTVKLQTSEDGATFSDVASVTVVPRGYARVVGATGKYTKVLSSSGLDIAHLVVELRNRAQVTPAL